MGERSILYDGLRLGREVEQEGIKRGSEGVGERQPERGREGFELHISSANPC